MVLFDGLHIPSVRRLARVARLLCFKPLIHFDPGLFSPSTADFVNSCYRGLLPHVFDPVCQTFVDPLASDLSESLSRIRASPADRVIIHYIGKGLVPGPRDGRLYFLSEGRANFRLVHLDSLLEFHTNVCLILDLSSAASLLPKIRESAQHRNIVAFLASGESEKLPSGPTAPLDILSSAILCPVDTALWFHGARDRFSPAKKCDCARFLESIIEAVALSQLSSKEFQAFFAEDPGLAAIARGFLLAARILAHFDVHACTFPEIPRTEDSEIWGFWDVAVEILAADDPENGGDLYGPVFEMLAVSFRNFQTASSFRLLSNFLGMPGHRSEAVELLYSKMAAVALPSSVARRLVTDLLGVPQALSYLVIARLMLEVRPDPGQVGALTGRLSEEIRDAGVLRALMLAVCCCLCHDGDPERSLGEACLKYADEGAPFSALLFGQLRAKGFTFCDMRDCFQKFEGMACDDNEDRRAAAVFALGQTWDLRAVPVITERLTDQSQMVVEEAVLALAVLLRFDPSRFKLDEEVVLRLRGGLEEVRKREDLREVYGSVQGTFENFFMRLIGAEGGGASPVRNVGVKPEIELRLVQRLKKSVRAEGLADRYEKCVFSSVK